MFLDQITCSIMLPTIKSRFFSSLNFNFTGRRWLFNLFTRLVVSPLVSKLQLRRASGFQPLQICIDLNPLSRAVLPRCRPEIRRHPGKPGPSGWTIVGECHLSGVRPAGSRLPGRFALSGASSGNLKARNCSSRSHGETRYVA